MSALPLTRRAGPADLAVLLALVEAFYAEDGHAYDPARVHSALGPLLAGDEHGQVWLVMGPAAPDPPRTPQAAVGYAVLTWGYSLESGGREALLDEIFLTTRGTGLGGAVLEEVLGAARAGGARAVFLETEAHNARVRRFYRRHRFLTEDSVWMRREL